jgi:DNA replication protein DnaC
MRWSRRPEGIVLIHGKCGRGKTYLAAAAKRELNLSGAGSNFVCEDEVLLTIKSAFGNDATTTEKGAYRQYTMSWPLIIDDIGISRVTDFTLDVWETIIGRRYRNDYPTLLTSNYGLDDLIKRVGDRVVDRIRESKQVVEYVGENRRII